MGQPTKPDPKAAKQKSQGIFMSSLTCRASIASITYLGVHRTCTALESEGPYRSGRPLGYVNACAYSSLCSQSAEGTMLMAKPRVSSNMSYWKCPKGPWRNSRGSRRIGLLEEALVGGPFHSSHLRNAREKEVAAGPCMAAHGSLSKCLSKR